jgi:hypothetical protein
MNHFLSKDAIECFGTSRAQAADSRASTPYYQPNHHALVEESMMAYREVSALWDPIQSQLFSTELANLLARLEGRSVGLVLERALRAYANASPVFAHYIHTPSRCIR